ncbi:MAG: hypothetical protein FWC64_09810 [Treponema sp.]|nr:hypothetical protein [Treponema sp.]
MYVLMELRHPDRDSWFFTNDNSNVEWEGRTYRATAMQWRFPESRDGVPQGGTLEITVDEIAWEASGYGAELLRWFDMADDRAEIVVKAIINEQGEVIPLDGIVQRHGAAAWDGKKITWNPDPDDRFIMHVNPWTLDQEALLV